MPLMTWTEKMSVGVKLLDEDHKKLVGMVNQLYDGICTGKGKESLGPILDGLIQYTQVHFAHEEEFFLKTGYAAAAAHKHEHDALTRQVLEVQSKFKAGPGATLSLEVMNFLKEWLVKHIQGSDQKYGPHLNARGIH
jgi:hemerythrin